MVGGPQTIYGGPEAASPEVTFAHFSRLNASMQRTVGSEIKRQNLKQQQNKSKTVGSSKINHWASALLSDEWWQHSGFSCKFEPLGSNIISAQWLFILHRSTLPWDRTIYEQCRHVETVFTVCFHAHADEHKFGLDTVIFHKLQFINSCPLVFHKCKK